MIHEEVSFYYYFLRLMDNHLLPMGELLPISNLTPLETKNIFIILATCFYALTFLSSPVRALLMY
jgi:hypothetical protein